MTTLSGPLTWTWIFFSGPQDLLAIRSLLSNNSFKWIKNENYFTCFFVLIDFYTNSLDLRLSCGLPNSLEKSLSDFGPSIVGSEHIGAGQHK